MLLKGKVGFYVGLICIVILLIMEFTGTDSHAPDPIASAGPYEVLRVIDGDTIEVNIDGEPVTVRMIGIDCPESVHPDESLNTEYGETAAEFTRSLLEGKNVVLEYDEQLTDDYDRTLAYVYLEGHTENSFQGSRTINAYLIEKGYARAMTIEPNTKYADAFEIKESLAQRNEVGFWASYYKDE